MKAMIFLASILASVNSMAAINLTITCSVHEEGERIDNMTIETSSYTIPNHGTTGKPLQLSVYGGKIIAETYLAPRKDNAKCEYKNTLICLHSGSANLCQDNKVVLYPDGAQVGDQTTIECKVTGDVAKHCKFE